MSIFEKMEKFDAFDAELKIGGIVAIQTKGWIVRESDSLPRGHYVVAKNEEAFRIHESQR